MPYQIVFDRPNCIACKACEVIAPEHWKISAEDGKSEVVGGSKTADGKMTRDIDDAALEANLNAAQSCPVNVIHLVNKANNEQVI
jgi:ferredoxin